MADAAMTIEAQSDNAFWVINTLALEVQSRAREAEYLIAAISDYSNEEGFGGDVVATSHLEAMDRIVVFCRLASEAAKRSANLGEQIEMAARPLRLVAGN